MIYRYFYTRLPVRKTITDDELHLLTPAENQAIRQKERFAIWTAAALGAMGVLLLYVPRYVSPHWFPVMVVELFGNQFELPLVMWVYSAMLVYAEIMLLTFLNIYCIHEIAVATGYIHAQNKQDATLRNTVLQIGTEKKNRGLLQYGIDPFQGLNKRALVAWNLLITLKATLTNILFRFFIQRILGRYALKAVQDFAGIPVFAAWNAWGSRNVLHQARVIILGTKVIEQICSKVFESLPNDGAVNGLLFQTMQFVAISKRDFHQNHALMAGLLFTHYNITPQQTLLDEAAYLEWLAAAPPLQKRVCMLIICTGMLLDGSLSNRERKRIQKLYDMKILDMDAETLMGYKQDFMNGRGIAPMLVV